ncbi:protein of unknown function [Methylorubrum extorquens]|uniref:Uncharacterized protein n=1 Tax=Methylorubrum extorquens TaxID=408 RepID=A0A2N9ATM7_METEX|nr:protein of unknown function [Methylorubrum extorquens]
MTDPWEIREAMVSELRGEPIRTMDHLQNEVVRQVRFRHGGAPHSGNRKARRAAAAKERRKA